ncbi:hypothetical protein BGY98DRAFT_939831 [Russula aff. rugulosa BPL654]|nr:hypothetical protein BGY98DRAFT_939831 [Russula aff. rugulosa BPL654]
MTEILTAKKTVRQRLDKTVAVARAGLFKATQKALSGKNTSVAVSILGGASTLVTSYMARMKGTNELRASKSRTRAVDRFINGFRLSLKGYSGTTLEASQSIGHGQQKCGAGVDPNVGIGGRTERKWECPPTVYGGKMSRCSYIVIVEDSDTTVPVPATHLPVTSGQLRHDVSKDRVWCYRKSIDLLFEGIPTSKGVISTYHKVIGAHANVLPRG